MLKKKCIELILTPSKIDKLKVIAGDFSYTLYTYRNEKINFNLDKKIVDFNLLCFHHSNNLNIYPLIEDGYIRGSWVDTEIDGDVILRVFGINKVYLSLKQIKII